MMKISNVGLDLIKKYESLHDGDLHTIGLQPKMCPAGYWTEGYGNVIKDKNGNMLKGIANKSLAYSLTKVTTEEEASKQLQENIDLIYGPFVNGLGLVLTQNQFDSLVSFSYNCGKNALRTSTLLKLIKTKAASNNIKRAFLMWNKSEGKALLGLTRRRTSEADLFLK